MFISTAFDDDLVPLRRVVTKTQHAADLWAEAQGDDCFAVITEEVPYYDPPGTLEEKMKELFLSGELKQRFLTSEPVGCTCEHCERIRKLN